jgi:hypothetical protein
MAFDLFPSCLGRLLVNVHIGPQWAAFEGAKQIVAQGLAAELIPVVLNGGVAFEDLPRTFLRSFYMKWLTIVIQERPALARFSTLTHEQRVSEFKQLDQRVLLENRASLVSQLRDRTQHQLQQPHINYNNLTSTTTTSHQRMFTPPET